MTGPGDLGRIRERVRARRHMSQVTNGMHSAIVGAVRP